MHLIEIRYIDLFTSKIPTIVGTLDYLMAILFTKFCSYYIFLFHGLIKLNSGSLPQLPLHPKMIYIILNKKSQSFVGNVIEETNANDNSLYVSCV